MTNRTYIIWCPSLTRSNGTRVLLRLAAELKAVGCRVFRYAHVRGGVADGVDCITDSELTREIREQAIVVYPEVVAGNPLRIRNVVRWVLYYPGRNGGCCNFHRGDKVFSFLPRFFPGAPVLTTPWLDESLFYDDGRERSLDCLFVHKGGKWKHVPELEDLQEINMRFPETRKGLAELLRSTRTLYSFDDCSSVLDEACLCGAKVLLVRKEGFEPYYSHHSQVVQEFPSQLRFFVKETSQMDWRGPLEGRLQFRAKINSIWLFVLLPIVRWFRAVIQKCVPGH